MTRPEPELPEVSIFVQVYNAAPFLGECLRSVFALEDVGEIEVIVIDDASTDGSAEVVNDFPDARLRLVRHESNRGAARTLNEGIALCRGNYIARIDADDRYRPGFLTETIGLLRRHPEAGAAYACIAMIDAQGRQTSTDRHPALPHEDEVRDRFLDLLDDHFITAPTLIARREIWLKAVPVPEQFHFCDWYCALRMAQAAPLAFRNTIVADYRVHSGGMHVGMVMDRSGERIYREVLDLFFAEPDHGEEKRARRNAIYARRYARLGDEYFGVGMMAAARQSYWRALRLDWRSAASPGLLRRWCATCLGATRYARLKRAWKFISP